MSGCTCSFDYDRCVCECVQIQDEKSTSVFDRTGFLRTPNGCLKCAVNEARTVEFMGCFFSCCSSARSNTKTCSRQVEAFAGQIVDAARHTVVTMAESDQARRRVRFVDRGECLTPSRRWTRLPMISMAFASDASKKYQTVGVCHACCSSCSSDASKSRFRMAAYAHVGLFARLSMARLIALCHLIPLGRCP